MAGADSLVGGVCHFRVQVWLCKTQCSQPSFPRHTHTGAHPKAPDYLHRHLACSSSAAKEVGMAGAGSLVGGVCHFRVQVWFSNPKCSQPTLPQAYPHWSTPKDSSLFKQTPGMIKLCRKGGGDGWSRQFGGGCIPLTGAGVVQQPPVLSSLTLSRIPTLEHTQRILIIQTDTWYAQALQQRRWGWLEQAV